MNLSRPNKMLVKQGFSGRVFLNIIAPSRFNNPPRSVFPQTFFFKKNCNSCLHSCYLLSTFHYFQSFHYFFFNFCHLNRTIAYIYSAKVPFLPLKRVWIFEKTDNHIIFFCFPKDVVKLRGELSRFKRTQLDSRDKKHDTTKSFKGQENQVERRPLKPCRFASNLKFLKMLWL